MRLRMLPAAVILFLLPGHNSGSNDLTSTRLRDEVCAKLQNLKNAPDFSPESASHLASVIVLDSQSEGISVYPQDCSESQALVGIRIRPHGKRFAVSLRSCANVIKILLHLKGDFRFARTLQHAESTSCDKKRDTVVVEMPKQRQSVRMTPLGRNGQKTFSLSLHYQYVDSNNSTSWSLGDMRQIELQPKPKEAVGSEEGNTMREKRSSSVSETAVKANAAGDPCGKSGTCVRFGAKDCKHLECDYLLSYTVINHTKLTLEISGKTDGWVALGLSSDNKMGGDEVIVCKRKSVLETDLEASSMWIQVPYSRPKPTSANSLQLLQSKVKDGHIYCKMTTDIGEPTVGTNALDLTSNWYQMYAKGKIDRSGIILQHDKTPPTSLEMVSMLRPVTIYSRAYKQLHSSAVRLGLSCFSFVSFVLPFIVMYLF
ncbi:uncharacterized protein LOC101860392 [Aplysia californica]|uniref:Uncharacterized protein LOC101860392 n=1 Tax=Aplysia californica TaxID=6500 RepID=A0ABM0ZVC1_APLCA|nr:uncharacterized protein LOC101860392 [Aplysia californica]